MTFDAKSLLTAPPMTVDALAERLAKIKMLGMGGAPVVLEGGEIGAIDLVAHGERPAHFVVKGKVMSMGEEMVNGETVEIRYQGQDWWYTGTVYKARKLQVELTGACDADTAPPSAGKVACENTIAEWRRPGSSLTYRNSPG